MEVLSERAALNDLGHLMVAQIKNKDRQYDQMVRALLPIQKKHSPKGVL